MLETWGLPITEYKLFNKPILAANLPYAHETVGNYNKVNFFNPDDAQMLSKYIMTFIENNSIFIKHLATKKSMPVIESWKQLCNFLLKSGVNK